MRKRRKEGEMREGKVEGEHERGGERGNTKRKGEMEDEKAFGRRWRRMDLLKGKSHTIINGEKKEEEV